MRNPLIYTILHTAVKKPQVGIVFYRYFCIFAAEYQNYNLYAYKTFNIWHYFSHFD